MRGFFYDLRVFSSLGEDSPHRFGKPVKGIDILSFGRLDHQGFGDDQREIDRRRMETEIEQPFGYIGRPDSCRFLPVGPFKYEFVHTGNSSVWKFISFSKKGSKIIRIDYSHFRNIGETIGAEHPDIGISPDEDTEIAEKGMYPSDRERIIAFQLETFIIFNDPGHGQKWDKVLRYPDRPRTRAPASVRSRKGFVKVEVNDIKTCVSWFTPAKLSVQVGAVHVHKRGDLMDRSGNLDDIDFEKSEGIRIRDHKGRCIFIECFL